MTAHYAHGRTDVGRAREVNEDAVLVEPQGAGITLLIVCDGLGGQGGGDSASRLASDMIAAHLREGGDDDPRRALYQALVNADHAVAQDPAGGASTAVVAWVRGDQAWVAWVGDSRLQHVHDGEVADVTQDHTRVADLIAQGELSTAQATTHPDRHIVTRALGSGDAVPDVWDEPVTLAPGDALVLYSDGLHDAVPDDEIASLIGGMDYRAAVDRLVALANDRGGHDNITVATLVAGTPQVGGVPHAPTKPAPGPTPRLTLAIPSATAPPTADVTPPRLRAQARSGGRVLTLVVVATLTLALGLATGFALRGCVDAPFIPVDVTP